MFHDHDIVWLNCVKLLAYLKIFLPVKAPLIVRVSFLEFVTRSSTVSFGIFTLRDDCDKNPEP